MTRPRPNDPTVLILTSLASGPKHGHALARDIEDFAGVRLGPGSLYGAITRLDEQGLIEALPTEDRRRPYRISAAGRNLLAESIEEMRRIATVGAKRLHSLESPASAGRAAPALRQVAP